MRRFVVALLLIAFAQSAFAQATAPRARPTKPLGVKPDQWQDEGIRGVVVAGGAEAVDAGMAMLTSGGNAADAAAATIFALTVTDAQQVCFGGEVPILVYDAKRKVVEVLCGQGTAPRLATREFFAKDGIPASGITPAAVPALLDVCLTLLDRYGTKTFAEAIQPTLQILDRREHDWHPQLATTLRRLTAAERESPHDRSRGLRFVADYFYRGPIARELETWSQASGGLLRYSDFATHVTRVEEPVIANYRGYTIYKCGAWTQGPYLLQTLQLLEGFDLRSLPQNSPEAVHLSIEALKLGLADRDVYYADPLFASVPLRELLSPRYADMRRPLIDPAHASLVQRPGDPRSGKPLLDAAAVRAGLGNAANDTTTCLAADGAGNFIAATPSGWTGVLAGETGIWLGSRLQSFNTWEGHVNCIEPGKRPRITLTPTLVLKDGVPVIAVSVAGGDGQDQVTLQMLTNLIDFGLSPSESVTRPRFVTNHFTSSFRQAPPELGSLKLNPDIGEATIAELKNRGHKVQLQTGAIWHPTVVTRDPQTKLFRGAGDPKAIRHARAF